MKLVGEMPFILSINVWGNNEKGLRAGYEAFPANRLQRSSYFL